MSGTMDMVSIQGLPYDSIGGVYRTVPDRPFRRKPSKSTKLYFTSFRLVLQRIPSRTTLESSTRQLFPFTNELK